MSDEAQDDTKPSAKDDPPGGHDPAALEDAKQMHVSEALPDAIPEPDPPGRHDPAALKDAAEKRLPRRQRGNRTRGPRAAVRGGEEQGCRFLNGNRRVSTLRRLRRSAIPRNSPTNL